MITLTVLILLALGQYTVVPPQSYSTVGWAALTPAEAKVAALVAEGRPNPDVATALLMSPATVKTHLSRIFTKLGVSNRQELMLAAVRRRPRSPGPTSEAGGDVTQGT